MVYFYSEITGIKGIVNKGRIKWNKYNNFVNCASGLFRNSPI